MGAGRRTVRAILAAAARGEEKSLQHHADTRVRLPIALWIPPARLFYETAMENIRVHVRRNEASTRLDRQTAKEFLDTTSLN
jgi:hypothetical protein|tara:strand:- start:224 stop:469 length:246 start_codon:yes stop_codon:yes gene_type:complete